MSRNAIVFRAEAVPTVSAARCIQADLQLWRWRCRKPADKLVLDEWAQNGLAFTVISLGCNINAYFCAEMKTFRWVEYRP
jgi:hypothetical protein